MHHRLAILLMLSLAGASGIRSAAQPAVPKTILTLTNAVQVRSLDVTASARHLPVQLRGIVIGEAEPGGQGFALQDETSGIYLTAPAETVAHLHPGDEIEVTGSTDPGWFSPSVVVTSLRHLGVKPLPKPCKVTYEELLSGKFDAQWVELSGIVRYCEPSANDPRKIRIEMVTGGGRLVLRWNVSQVPGPLVDAEICVRGVCYYLANQHRQWLSPMIAIPHDIPLQIKVPGLADPFSLPFRPLGSLMNFDREGAYGHRIHVRGTVTRYLPGELVFIRADGLGLRIQTAQKDNLQPGDEIEALGFPQQGSYSPVLEESVFRKIASGSPPGPVPLVTPADLGGLDANLVELDAVFDKQYATWANFYEFHTESGMNFQALLRFIDKQPGWPRLAVGGRYQVVGVCAVEPHAGGLASGLSQPGSFQILLRTPADLVLLAPPPWWTRQHVIRALVATAALALAACGVVLWLARRRLQAQEARRLAAEREFALIFTERNRMAREIHDTLAQGLGGISIHLECIKNRLKEPPPEIARHLEISRELVRHSLTDARHAIWDMRSQALQEGDLVSALNTNLQQLTEGSPVTARFTVTGRARRISPLLENDLLHIGQEALCNAVKHARAHTIELTLNFGETEIRLSVQDDGCGFSPAIAPPRNDSFGLIGMRERVRQWRGQLLVQSQPGAGTQILATVPAA